MQLLRFTRAEDYPEPEAPAADPAVDEVQLDVSGLLGTWWNTDKATRGISKLVLSEDGPSLIVHAFGACLPDACDWGKAKAVSFSASVASREAMAFTTHYDFGFMETTLAVYMKGGILVLDSFNAFKDSSGRCDYFSREFFHN
jgi:hypothetical protein